MQSVDSKKRAIILAADLLDDSLVLRQPNKNGMLNRSSTLFRQHLYFVLFVLASVFVYWTPLKQLIRFSLTRDYGSHIPLVVPASAYLICLNRREIFSKFHSNFVVGTSLLLAAATLGWVAHNHSCVDGDYLSVEILTLIVLWISGFILCYGSHALRAARFPLLFLLWMVPIPDFLLDEVINVLQAGSAAVAYWLFRALHVPVLQQGFVLLLPRLEIEVAKECSGIRSSVALLITTLLAGQFVLRSIWRKSVLMLSALPILILKNGVRIVTISLLTIDVDRRFLHGPLHTSGGIVFYLLGLLALLPILVLLKKGDIRSDTSSNKMPTVGNGYGLGRWREGKSQP